jgi:hypothetical protein
MGVSGLYVGIVQLDKGLCRSHDSTLVRDGLARPEKRAGLVGETERQGSVRLDTKHMS